MSGAPNPDRLFAEAAAAKAEGQPDEAAELYARAIALRPDFVQARVNLANLLIRLGRPDEAIAQYDVAVGLAPNYAQAYANKAVALAALNRHAAAVEAYDQALRIAPDFKEAQYGKALRLLQLGRYAEGWPLYEARWSHPAHGPRPYPDTPYWTGDEPVRGETLLVHAEQGLGDTLQFCRYLPALAELGAEIVLHAAPVLHPLLAALPGVAALVRDGDPAPRFHRHVSLLSLPLAFGSTLETLPRPGRYLAPPADRVRAWARRLPRRRYRVGLAWSGNPEHHDDHNRSIPFERLAPLFGADIEFVALQTGRRAGDAAGLAAAGVVDLATDLRDFADTAAIADSCDLVISVDTSIVHLAGALGRPVWVLLPFSPDWRWLSDRADSPWHPSARLLRQPAPGDWRTVVTGAATALRALRPDGRADSP
jgi:hypothetical protein